MTDAPPTTSADPGRWIRLALVMLPIGTIFLGIASFGIWQWKKDQAEDRSFKYALALRRPISLEGIQRHAGIIREALAKPDWHLSIPGYLESTMGAENMGYTVRRMRYENGGAEKAVVDAELTGRQMVREVYLVLVLLPGDESMNEAASLALAEMLAVAHSLTGEPMSQTIRFVAAPDDEAAFKELQNDLRRHDEHLGRLTLLGGFSARTIQLLESTLETVKCGTLVRPEAPLKDAAQTLQAATALREHLMHFTAD